MQTVNYADFLKSPQWQRVRLEVFQRDNFKCVACSNDSEQLHCHHQDYKDRLNPAKCSSLCASCHERLEEIIKLVRANPVECASEDLHFLIAVLISNRGGPQHNPRGIDVYRLNLCLHEIASIFFYSDTSDQAYATQRLGDLAHDVVRYEGCFWHYEI